MYKEEKSFNVLKGRVPDFSGGDIILSYTINKEPTTELKGFPNRNSGYVVNEVKCENKVTADWNNYSWALEDINNPENAKQIKCTVDFRKSTLNGAEPVYEGTELIPVKIDNTGKVTKADTSSEWYNYDKKEWANAIIPTSAAKLNVEGYEAGHEITESEIESYFVWIPKYSYRLFDDQLGKYETTESSMIDKGPTTAIEIRFGTGNTIDNEEECKTPMLSNNVQGESGGSGKCSKGKWMTHPAFLAFNTTGLWVGKFETHNGGNNSIQIKPNVTSWGNIIVFNSFTYSKNYKSELQSHLMKNTEWGAVAYLTQSIYGRCENENSCSEVAVNNTYTTGYTSNNMAYTSGQSTGASTTNNYSGVYDMNGGYFEIMASVMLDAKNASPLYDSNTGFNTNNFPVDERYYEVYNYGNSSEIFSRRILGDATGELGPFGKGPTNAYGNILGTSFVYPKYTWFDRSGAYDLVNNSPLNFYVTNGDNTHGTEGFRIVLAVSKS